MGTSIWEKEKQNTNVCSSKHYACVSPKEKADNVNRLILQDIIGHHMLYYLHYLILLTSNVEEKFP